MGQGQTLTAEKIEIIKATYAETGNYSESARAARVSVATAKKYVDTQDDLEELRKQKRVSLIDHIADVQAVLLDAMTEPKRLGKASLSELGNQFSNLTEKRLLLTGQATARTETLTADSATKLTPDERMLAARLRDKLISDGA
jgi:hypothetical protein